MVIKQTPVSSNIQRTALTSNQVHKTLTHQTLPLVNKLTQELTNPH